MKTNKGAVNRGNLTREKTRVISQSGKEADGRGHVTRRRGSKGQMASIKMER